MPEGPDSPEKRPCQGRLNHPLQKGSDDASSEIVKMLYGLRRSWEWCQRTGAIGAELAQRGLVLLDGVALLVRGLARTS